MSGGDFENDLLGSDSHSAFRAGVISQLKAVNVAIAHSRERFDRELEILRDQSERGLKQLDDRSSRDNAAVLREIEDIQKELTATCEDIKKMGNDLSKIQVQAAMISGFIGIIVVAIQLITPYLLGK